MNKSKLAVIGAGVVGSIACSYFLYRLAKLHLLRRKYKHIPGPPANGIKQFFFGNLDQLVETIANGKMLGDFITECHQKYGDVIKYQIGETVYVSIRDREAIKEIYVNQNYPFAYDSFFGIFNERVFGFGLAMDSDMIRWKKRRAIFNHGFHRDVLMTFVNQFNSKSDILMEKLRIKADGKTVINLLDEFSRLTLDAIAQIAFGLNVNSVCEKDTELYEALAQVLKSFNDSLYDPYLEYKWSMREQVKNTIKSIKYLRKLGADIINERLNQMKTEKLQPGNDILSCILNSWTDNNMDIEIMIDDFVLFFFAGQESTADALASCFLELMLNPEIFKKAREEVDQVIGSKNEISYQDANNLKYCSYIFKETLRLHPPSPEIFRRNLHEMNINGFRIPKDSTMVVSIYSCARNAKYFKDSLVFNPERFTLTEKSIENYTYMPFSVGPRNCIGQNFANIQSIILIAKMIQKFDLKLDQSQEYKFEQIGTIKPLGGCKCTLKLRS